MKDLFELEDFSEFESHWAAEAVQITNDKLNKLIESWPLVYGIFIKYFENSSFESVFKNGFDCRDKLDNEALKLAVEAIEDIVGCEAELFGEKVVKALAEIKKLTGGEG